MLISENLKLYEEQQCRVSTPCKIPPLPISTQHACNPLQNTYAQGGEKGDNVQCPTEKECTKKS